MFIYVNTPSMPIICIYACNYRQQLVKVGHFCSSGICLVISWQRYNTLNQRNLFHRRSTLYRFLHIGTKSINAYHRKHPANVWGFPSYATIIEHLSISIYLSAAHNLHINSETIITSKFTPCFQRFSVVSKENRLQTSIKCAIIADLVLQINTNSFAFPASYV